MSLAAADVTDRGWRFSRTDGTVLAPILQLSHSGDVVIHNNPAEVGWDIQHDRLLFLDNVGRPTTSFEVEAETRGRLHLIGRHLLTDGHPMVHRLTGARPYDPTIPPLASCQIRTELGRDTDALVVTLNGGGCTAGDDPRQTFFEMAGYAASIGADAVMVAEREECCAGYADKADMIADLVDALLVRRYRTVLFLGTSAGGYGCILSAELLAERHPALNVASVTINPQTSMHEVHVGHVHHHLPARYAPGWISAGARAGSRPEWKDLPTLLSAPRAHTAIHHVFFDSGNPAELYYSNLLQPFANCRRYGERYRLSHMLGVAAIYATKAPHRIALATARGGRSAHQSPACVGGASGSSSGPFPKRQAELVS